MGPKSFIKISNKFFYVYGFSTFSLKDQNFMIFCEIVGLYEFYRRLQNYYKPLCTVYFGFKRVASKKRREEHSVAHLLQRSPHECQMNSA